MNTRWYRTLKRLHSEGIPWPASAIYNALSKTDIFRKHYQLVAAELAEYGPAGRILDVGTGPGWLLLALQKAFPEAQLVGVDISPAMVETARRNLQYRTGAGGIHVTPGSAQNLPFADGEFDRVVSTGSIHHWKDQGAGLAEAHRVLRPGGLALICDLVRILPKSTRDDVLARFGRYWLALLWLHSFAEPFLHADDMEALARRTTFRLEAVKFVGALCCLVLRKETEVPASPGALAG